MFCNERDVHLWEVRGNAAPCVRPSHPLMVWCMLGPTNEALPACRQCAAKDLVLDIRDYACRGMRQVQCLSTNSVRVNLYEEKLTL